MRFAVHKLGKFSSSPVKLHFKSLVHLLWYISDNKTFGLKYDTNTIYAPLSDMLRQATIETENQLMAFYNSSCQDCPDTGRITGAYIIFYQVGTLDHCTRIPVSVAQSSAESEYNVACTARMNLAHFRMLINEWFNMDLYIVPEGAPRIILDSKSAAFMDNNGKDTRHK